MSYVFVNDSSADAQVYYLGSNDQAILYDTLAPHGGSYTPKAATGQVWMVANSGGGCLGILNITGSGQATVSG